MRTKTYLKITIPILTIQLIINVLGGEWILAMLNGTAVFLGLTVVVLEFRPSKITHEVKS